MLCAVTHARVPAEIEMLKLDLHMQVSPTDLSPAESAILIAGFVIAGSSPRTLLIRGVGPALAPYVPSGLLQDPVLSVYREQELIGTNDDWGGDTSLLAAMKQAGAFVFTDPTSRDSALIITLPPGAYTAQVRGANDSTGLALGEVYELR